MTKQPDTAAIRAESRGNTYRYLAGIVMVLCDALDAARMELSDQERWTARANASTLEQRLRAEAAEARIAAVLEVIDETPSSDLLHLRAHVRRALTEGTGQ